MTARMPDAAVGGFEFGEPITSAGGAAAGADQCQLARLRYEGPRPSVTMRQSLAGVAPVIGIYVVTALEHAAPAVAVTVLI